jgi:hypothetical protein
VALTRLRRRVLALLRWLVIEPQDRFPSGKHTGNDCNNDSDDCVPSIFDARQCWDWYGWTDFGDASTEVQSSHSACNPEYDMNLGFLQQAPPQG